MSPEPWKKAHDRSRLKQAGLEDTGGKGKHAAPPGLNKPRTRWGLIIALTLLVLVIGGGIGGWFTRELWYPKLKQIKGSPVAEVIVDAVPEPEVEVDWLAIEDGLGIEMAVFGDYLEVIGATNEYMTDWELKQMGGGNLRLTAEGVKVYVRNGLISEYQLDLGAVFAVEGWGPWQRQLRAAGLSPDTSWTAVTGDAEMPTENTSWERVGEAVQAQGSWVRVRWKLSFNQGWLRRVSTELVIGAASEFDPDAPDILPGT